ncbi:hypothetical protein INT47_007807 [Mucor saturninus]|uniref:Uncharacterized protein n=1 Tax=Mucor saturninus TaxID=64648 RepID=A0A8H7RFD2_9FUNG|nr:hypothetical protein INT47_007807 [Mucor saturninus]
MNEFDRDSINGVEDTAEDDEDNYQTEFSVPSFEETVGSSKTVVSTKEAFEKESPGFKTFAENQSAEHEFQEFYKSQNIPFGTLRSNKVYLKLVYKHFGEYRNTRDK